MDKNDIIYQLQDRKTASIAYFNSLNAAIEVCKAMYAPTDTELFLKHVSSIRDHFLGEFNVYSREVMDRMKMPGDNKEIGSTIESIYETKSVPELRKLYLSMREGLRIDPAVKKAVDEQKRHLSE